jgi:hypothetical protein
MNIEVMPILTRGENDAMATLVKIDKITMLFDCGWNERFSEDISSIYVE